MKFDIYLKYIIAKFYIYANLEYIWNALVRLKIDNRKLPGPFKILNGHNN